VPLSLYELADMCNRADAPKYDGAPAADKPASKPQKVAVFVRYADDPKSTFEKQRPAALGDLAATDARGVPLVACVDVKKHGEDPGHCSYYGGQIHQYTMTHTLRVLEVKTGRELLRDEFTLDHRTGSCPSTYAFPAGTHTVFRGVDFGPTLASELLPFEPAGVALAPAKAQELDVVCGGGAVPQAAAYTPADGAKIHLLYFPNDEQSWTRTDPPKGFPAFDDNGADAAGYELVACVTGKPAKKKRSCKFMLGDVLETYDGELEVVLREARTGKIVETKSFKATSPGGCPATHKFWGKTDRIMKTVDPAFGKWLGAHAKG
jgi:hypothetical protein